MRKRTFRSIVFSGILIISFLSLNQLHAQDTTSANKDNSIISPGIGIGLDYGGVGLNFLAYPQKNIGLFAGVGYAAAGIGYNVGTKIRLLSHKKSSRTVPFFMAMYGYNAVIVVTNESQYNKFFYGPTIGIGCDLHSRHKENGYLSMALLVPIRSQEITDYINELENNAGVSFSETLLPVAFSIGYTF